MEVKIWTRRWGGGDWDRVMAAHLKGLAAVPKAEQDPDSELFLLVLITTFAQCKRYVGGDPLTDTLLLEALKDMVPPGCLRPSMRRPGHQVSRQAAAPRPRCTTPKHRPSARCVPGRASSRPTRWRGG